MPVAAPRPAAANAHAAAPSRGPQPPMLSGIEPASTAMSATAMSRSAEASTPDGEARDDEGRDVAATTSADATTTLGDGADGAERGSQRRPAPPERRRAGAPAQHAATTTADADDERPRGARCPQRGA